MGRKRPNLDSGEEASLSSLTSEQVDVVSKETEVERVLATVLDGIVEKFATNFLTGSDGAQPSISDVIKVVQLRRDLRTAEPLREVEVRWVES